MKQWSGYPDPDDPDNFWIDDKTGERVNAWTGEREQVEKENEKRSETATPTLR